jgi:hypothetical protein
MDVFRSWQGITKAHPVTQLLQDSANLSSYLNLLHQQLTTRASCYQAVATSQLNMNSTTKEEIYLSLIQMLRALEDGLWLFLWLLERIVVASTSKVASDAVSPSNKLVAEVDKAVEQLVSILESSIIRCVYTLPFALHSK